MMHCAWISPERRIDFCKIEGCRDEEKDIVQLVAYEAESQRADELKDRETANDDHLNA